MTPLLQSAKRLREDRNGAITVMVAGSLLMLLGVATVSVDLGSIYLAQRKLQGIADAAAMAAAQEDSLQTRAAAAQGIIEESEEADVAIDSLENGTYVQDKDLPIDRRFQSGGEENAARIALVQTVPLFFGRALGFRNATVRARATAARIDMAAYSLGSSLAKVSDGVPNALLSGLVGSRLNLSVLDSQNLAAAQIDVLGFAGALQARANARDVTYGELFATPVPIGDILKAIASTASEPATAALIERIADAAPFAEVTPGEILDLGPYGRLDHDPGTAHVEVDAFSLVRTFLEATHGDTFDLDFELAASGLSNVHVRLVRGYGQEHSPWLTITGARDYTLRTAQARILVTARAATGNPWLPSVELPIYTDLAQAEATLDDIRCSGNPASDGVTLGVTPAIGTVGIGIPDARDMDDLSEAVTLAPATLVHVPLIAKVTAKSEISLGGTAPTQKVVFTPAEIRNKVTKTVSTTDLTRSLATSLIAQTDLQAQTLGMTLGLSSITDIVGNTLSALAPALDTTLFSLTQTLGVRVGAADVRVSKVRCGIPTLIA